MDDFFQFSIVQSIFFCSSGLLFPFVPALLLSILTPPFELSSVSLSNFILAVPMV